VDPLKVFRLDYDNLLVACSSSETLQFFMAAKRKTVRVSEIPTSSENSIHKRAEIIEQTLEEIAERQSDKAFYADAHRGLLKLDSFLRDYRKNLLC
jgi:hypothetical protein